MFRGLRKSQIYSKMVRRFCYSLSQTDIKAFIITARSFILLFDEADFKYWPIQSLQYWQWFTNTLHPSSPDVIRTLLFLLTKVTVIWTPNKCLNIINYCPNHWTLAEFVLEQIYNLNKCLLKGYHTFFAKRFYALLTNQCNWIFNPSSFEESTNKNLIIYIGDIFTWKLLTSLHSMLEEK